MARTTTLKERSRSSRQHETDDRREHHPSESNAYVFHKTTDPMPSRHLVGTIHDTTR